MWSDIYQNVLSTISTFGVDTLFFRGHAKSNWKLLPKLGRYKNLDLEVERIVYFDYVVRAGSLLQENGSSWSNIFSMQHHGIPTRLLDWTESFAVALYFAIRDADEDACIWILDPFTLNKETIGEETLYDPSDLGADYREYYIDETKKMGHKVVAMNPLRHHPRIFNQKSGVTLHNDLKIPLEMLCPTAVKKIEIPVAAFDEAFDFLTLSGISEFSVFPDLDGLAREINKERF
jgi:hypothetical protein